MSEPATKVNPVERELRRYGKQLLPGAVEQLTKMWAPLASWPPDKLAEEVAARVQGKLGERFRNPDYTPPPEAKNPLRAALLRHADELSEPETTVEKLVSAWGLAVAGKTPSQIEGEVTRRLSRREGWQYLKVHPERPLAERQVREALDRFRGELKAGVDLDALAQAWAPEVGQGPPHAVRRAVAARLAMPVHASSLTPSGAPLQVNLGDAEYRAPAPDPEKAVKGF
jgi:hypothetical protein